MTDRNARMALAPRTVQNMPDCLQREVANGEFGKGWEVV